MLSGVCFGSNDLIKSGQFYDAVLRTIGLQRLFENKLEIGYGQANQTPSFWILKPYNQQATSFGNGTQVMFVANSTTAVNNFFATAIQHGGQDEGQPGPRNYRPGYYGAYVRDLDGNKCHVFCIDKNAQESKA